MCCSCSLLVSSDSTTSSSASTAISTSCQPALNGPTSSEPCHEPFAAMADTAALHACPLAPSVATSCDEPASASPSSLIPNDRVNGSPATGLEVSINSDRYSSDIGGGKVTLKTRVVLLSPSLYSSTALVESTN